MRTSPYSTPIGRDSDANTVLNRIRESKQLLQTLRYQWYDSIAFLNGDQWGDWDRSLGRMRQRPQVPWRVRITDNQILPLVKN